MVNVWSMIKKNYCFKNPCFAKNAIFSKIMSQSKEMFWLIQAPYISKHISRNGGATIKASRKTAHNKDFLFWGKKAIFFPKMVAPSKKSYSPKYVYWYQCFSVWKMVGAKSSVHSWPLGRQAQRFHNFIDSYCLCMWVNKQFKSCKTGTGHFLYDDCITCKIEKAKCNTGTYHWW